LTSENDTAHPRARHLPAVKPPRINWQQIIADLRANGCSLHRVATHIGVEYSTAQRWRRPRADLGYGYGRALLRLHSRYCGAALTLQRLTEADDGAYTASP